MPLGTEINLGPGDVVLYVVAAPPLKEAQPPVFGPCLLWPNGWMAVGMEVGLGPVHIVLDGDTTPLPKKGAEPPIFGPFLLWPNGWMHHDPTW